MKSPVLKQNAKHHSVESPTQEVIAETPSYSVEDC